MRTRTAPVTTMLALSVAVACSPGSSPVTDAPVDDAPAETLPGFDEVAADPPALAPPKPVPTEAASTTPGGPIALIGDRAHLVTVEDGVVDETWLKWQAHVSPDRSTAVMSIQPDVGRRLDSTRLAWAELPSGERVDGYDLGPGITLDVDAVSHGGDFVALTNFADVPRTSAIAGAKTSTTLVIADSDGIVHSTSLDGNFVAEAFGRRVEAGLPAQVFLLEYFPAEAPQFYRVRVYSTSTREVSLPLNLRDKSQQIDEQMAGLSRSQVYANDAGLLFTLYRGTIDGTPDGEPYAFIHTLDLADGVWCLDVSPELELDRLPGSLAVADDRLYVASANGRVGSFDVPSISDADRSPTMDWVTEVAAPGTEPPPMIADDQGVLVGVQDISGRVVRLAPDGRLDGWRLLPGALPNALGEHGDELVAVGDGWTTFGDVAFPDWFGAAREVIAG